MDVILPLGATFPTTPPLAVTVREGPAKAELGLPPPVVGPVPPGLVPEFPAAVFVGLSPGVLPEFSPPVFGRLPPVVLLAVPPLSVRVGGVAGLAGAGADLVGGVVFFLLSLPSSS